MLVVFGPLHAQCINFLLLCLRVERLVGFDFRDEFFDITAQDDVGTATCHVGGDGDHLGATSLGHDVGLTCVLFGVEHLVWQLGLVQHLSNEFGILNRGGAD